VFFVRYELNSFIYVLGRFSNKQRLFPETALTGWAL
jgi:hypothetical protein